VKERGKTWPKPAIHCGTEIVKADSAACLLPKMVTSAIPLVWIRLYLGPWHDVIAFLYFLKGMDTATRVVPMWGLPIEHESGPWTMNSERK
jgi:hypothetical protein